MNEVLIHAAGTIVAILLLAAVRYVFQRRWPQMALLLLLRHGVFIGVAIIFAVAVRVGIHFLPLMDRTVAQNNANDCVAYGQDCPDGYVPGSYMPTEGTLLTCIGKDDKSYQTWIQSVGAFRALAAVKEAGVYKSCDLQASPDAAAFWGESKDSQPVYSAIPRTPKMAPTALPKMWVDNFQ